MYYTGRYNGSGQDFPQVNQLFTDSFPKTATTTDANWIWTSNSSVVNEARFGYNNDAPTLRATTPASPMARAVDAPVPVVVARHTPSTRG